MKAYYVWPKKGDPFGEGVDVVFANDVNEAKKIAYYKGTVIREAKANYFEMQVKRVPHLDWWAKLVPTSGTWEDFFLGDPCFMREAFYYAGQFDTCISCLKSDLSFLHPDLEAQKFLKQRWSICPECGFCRQCGHDAKCSKTK